MRRESRSAIPVEYGPLPAGAARRVRARDVVRRARSCAGRGFERALYAPADQQDDNDDQENAEATARIITPTAAVRPGWQGDDEEKDEDDEQDRTHLSSPFSSGHGNHQRPRGGPVPPGRDHCCSGGPSQLSAVSG